MFAFRNLEDAMNKKTEMETETNRRWEVIGPRSGTSHPYDVCMVPVVGDIVSYGFNGDSYVAGKIVKKTEKTVVVEDGSVFRKNKFGFWKMNQVWTMIFGEHNTRNPEF